MKIRTDDNGYVTEYAALGDIQGADEFYGAIPEAFEENCWQYRLQDGELWEVSDEQKREILRSRFGLSEQDIQAYFGGGA